MTNEWQELDLENTPSDLLKSDAWEMEEFFSNDGWVRSSLGDVVDGLIYFGCKTSKFRIRRKIKEPTHEEICTLWWKYQYSPNDHAWSRVDTYRSDGIYEIAKASVDKSWFIGRESRECPPEVEE